MIYVVFPAHNAAATIKATLANIPDRAKYQILVCDDASSDNTVQVARELGLEVIVHPENRGYGANQKTLYNAVLGRMRLAETKLPSFGPIASNLQSASKLGFNDTTPSSLPLEKGGENSNYASSGQSI